MQKRFKAFIDGNNLMLDDQVFPIDLTTVAAIENQPRPEARQGERPNKKTDITEIHFKPQAHRKPIWTRCLFKDVQKLIAGWNPK